MNTKISMHRVFFMLYIILMILSTGIVNINLSVVIGMIIISIILYNCKTLTYTRNLYYIYSILMLIYIGLYMNIPIVSSWNERSVIWLQALPYLLLGVIIFTLSLYNDISKKPVK
jgi:hypothetical protein